MFWIKEMRLVFIVPLLLFVLLAISLAVGLKQHDEILPSALLNTEVPAFELPSVYKDQTGLSSRKLHGSYSLLNVFASWCVACRAEHSVLMELSRTHNIPVFGLNWRDEDAVARKWLAHFGNPYRAIGADHQGQVAISLGVTGAPETYVVDPQGIIVAKVTGPLTQETVEREILSRIKVQ